MTQLPLMYLSGHAWLFFSSQWAGSLIRSLACCVLTCSGQLAEGKVGEFSALAVSAMTFPSAAYAISPKALSSRKRGQVVCHWYVTKLLTFSHLRDHDVPFLFLFLESSTSGSSYIAYIAQSFSCAVSHRTSVKPKKELYCFNFSQRKKTDSLNRINCNLKLWAD